MKIDKKFPVYVSKNTFEIHSDLLLIEKEVQPHHVLIKDFKTFMYNQHCIMTENTLAVNVCKLLALHKY